MNKNSVVYDSVLTCARTKIIFGEASSADLRVLIEDLAIDLFDPKTIKDEITHLELDPIESVRHVVTIGSNKTSSRTEGSADSEVDTITEAHASAQQSGSSTGRNSGRSRGTNHVDTASQATQEGAGASESRVIPVDGGLMPRTVGTNESESNVDSSGSADGTNASESEGVSSAAFESNSEQHSEGFARARGRTTNTAETESAGSSVSRTATPFYEYRKQRVVSSRTFVSFEEFVIGMIQRFKRMRQGEFAIKVPGQPLCFMKAFFVATPWVSERDRQRAMHLVFSRPGYAKSRLCSGEWEAPAALKEPAPMLESRHHQLDEGILLPLRETKVISKLPIRSHTHQPTPWDDFGDE